MHGLTGTWQLFKLGLRLDRIKLLVVISTLSFMLFLTVGEVHKTYGSDQAALTSYAAASAPSVVGRVFAGPLDGPYAGSVVLNEAYLFTAVAVAFMSTLAVVRHTRQNEEFGRSELVGSTVVSRHASLVAALLVATTANVVFGVVTVLAFWLSGLPLYGSILTGLAMMATGLCFATIAAVAAQLTDSARGANALCALAIGIAFILRGVGDSLGTLVNDGLGVQSSFISWLSPLGWGQQLYPFTQQRVWVFALFIAISITCVSAAVALMNKRDIGLGTFPTRLGRSRAATSLLGVSGLTRKLQHTTLRGWAVAITVLGISFGLSIGEFQGLLAENDEFQQIFAQFGGDVTKAFLGLLVSFMTIAVAGYTAQALLRMRSEEAGGQLENVLGASVNRYRWMGSHILFVAAGVVMLSVLSALGIGVRLEGFSWHHSLRRLRYLRSSALW